MEAAISNSRLAAPAPAGDVEQSSGAAGEEGGEDERRGFLDDEIADGRQEAGTVHGVLPFHEVLVGEEAFAGGDIADLAEPLAGDVAVTLVLQGGADVSFSILCQSCVSALQAVGDFHKGRNKPVHVGVLQNGGG